VNIVVPMITVFSLKNFTELALTSGSYNPRSS